MNECVISIGSNSNDKNVRVRECITWLCQVMTDSLYSESYTTTALNGKDGDYVNAVVSGCVECGYDELVALMKCYEKDNGRTHESKSSGVIPIDVDVVMWNGEIKRIADYNQSYFQIGWNQINGNDKGSTFKS